MDINTDLVKSKKYITPIKSSIQNSSQEYRILATLRYLYPGRFDNMIKSESPDLQDSGNSAGIEVTVAVRQDDMKASRAFSELCQGEPEKKEKYKEIIKNCGYSCDLLNGEKLAISSSGTSDEEKLFFQDSIRKKVKKLPRYRTKFTTVGLAILLPEIPTSYAEAHLSKWISDSFKGIGNSFDFIYVISHRFCIYYDVQTNGIEKHTLTQDESNLLSTIGRMTAEGELSLMDKEWL